MATGAMTPGLYDAARILGLAIEDERGGILTP